MYEIEIKPELDKKLEKLFKKDRKKYEIIMKKIKEIIENPHHYKNLRKPLQNLKRVHIDTSFVLTFSVEENIKKITFQDYEHHDKIYLK